VSEHEELEEATAAQATAEPAWLLGHDRDRHELSKAVRPAAASGSRGPAKLLGTS
jgi:hypothetical protein